MLGAPRVKSVRGSQISVTPTCTSPLWMGPISTGRDPAPWNITGSGARTRRRRRQPAIVDRTRAHRPGHGPDGPGSLRATRAHRPGLGPGWPRLSSRDARSSPGARGRMAPALFALTRAHRPGPGGPANACAMVSHRCASSPTAVTSSARRPALSDQQAEVLGRAGDPLRASAGPTSSRAVRGAQLDPKRLGGRREAVDREREVAGAHADVRDRAQPPVGGRVTPSASATSRPCAQVSISRAVAIDAALIGGPNHGNLRPSATREQLVVQPGAGVAASRPAARRAGPRPVPRRPRRRIPPGSAAAAVSMSANPSRR